MDIKEIRDKKEQLEHDLYILVDKFMIDTGLPVDDLEIYKVRTEDHTYVITNIKVKIEL